MIEFKKLAEDDIPLLRRFLGKQPYKICDLSPGTVYLWKDYYNTKYAVIDGFFVAAYETSCGCCTFSCPVSEDGFDAAASEQGDPRREAFKGVLRKVRAEASACKDCCFTNITEELLPIFEETFPGITYETDESWSDYLYAYEDLARLKGRKYSAKRNHISRFLRDYPDYEICEITPENKAEVRDFYLNRYLSEHAPEEGNEEEAEEAETARFALENLEALGMTGVFLRAAGEIAAFAIGEICADTLIVHIEKAVTSANGSYAVINKGFACFAERDGLAFINREEDMGDPGLRKAKLSYQPIKMLLKYIVHLPKPDSGI